MKNIKVMLVVAMVASLGVLALARSGPLEIPWDQAKAHVGSTCTVTGPVLGAVYLPKVNGSPTFLNVGRAHPDPARFTVVIWGEARSRWDPPPEVQYAGRTIQVTGKITVYKGVAEIVATTPTQIKAQ